MGSTAAAPLSPDDGRLGPGVRTGARAAVRAVSPHRGAPPAWRRAAAAVSRRGASRRRAEASSWEWGRRAGTGTRGGGLDG